MRKVLRPTKEEIAKRSLEAQAGFTDVYGVSHPPWDERTRQLRAGTNAIQHCESMQPVGDKRMSSRKPNRTDKKK